MSRRRDFDTGLTESERAPKPVSDEPKPKKGPKKSHQPSKNVVRASTSGSDVPASPAQEVSAVVAPAIAKPAEEEDGDDSLCFICAEPITFWSVGVCGHKTCHICAVRLRTFYKKYECTFCKTVTPSLLFSRSPDCAFPAEHHVQPSPPNKISAAQNSAEKLEKGRVWYDGLTLPGTLDLEQFEFSDDKLGVVFEDEELMDSTLLLLRFNCPSPDCAHMATDWSSLEKHTLSNHGMVICRVCRSQLSRFAHEQVLYPPHLLPLHDPSRLRQGQRPPKPRGEKEIEMVKSWDAPHPICEFCHQAFFGPDELFSHMRTKHEECFVCKQLGERDVYFKDYAKLEQHFGQEHHPCRDPKCLEQKFVVFPSDLDLKAHQVEVHGTNMSNRDRAQARTVAVDFPSYTEVRRGGSSQNQQGGRGFTIARAPVIESARNGNNSNSNGNTGNRDAPQAQQLSQPPLMTAEQAAQHRRQIQTDAQDSKRRRAFDTGLTGSVREQRNLVAGTTSQDNDGGRRSGYATPREDVDDATAERHAALLNRVSLLVNDSEVKLSSFRSAVRQFRTNESGAKDMVDTIFHVLDRDMDATSGVVREIAGLLELENETEKNKSVLEALNGLRVEQREQFPALHTPSGYGTEWSGIASGKILNAKRTTHTAGRSGTSRAVWDRVEAAASESQGSSSRAGPRATVGVNGRFVPGASGAASASSFPSLGSGSTAGPSARPAQHSTPWASGGAGSSSKAPSALAGPIIRSVNYPSAPNASKPRPLNTSAFPSLPASSGNTVTAAERKALFNKPNPREESIRRITGMKSPPPTASTGGWGSSSSTPVNELQGLEINDDAAPVAGTTAGGKKKGKGKQLLFAVSARPN